MCYVGYEMPPAPCFSEVTLLEFSANPAVDERVVISPPRGDEPSMADPTLFRLSSFCFVFRTFEFCILLFAFLNVFCCEEHVFLSI